MSLMVLITENAPQKLRGRLNLWLLEVRAGVYVGNVTTRVREMIWDQTLQLINKGNAVIIWQVLNTNGFSFQSCGQNRRMPIDADGMLLVAMAEQASNSG